MLTPIGQGLCQLHDARGNVAEKISLFPVEKDLKGQKKIEREEKNKNFHLIERSSGSFQRSLRLPFEADPATVEARFANGVLTVMLPKPAEVKSKTQKIAIKAS